jgi:hypothetical protein
VLDNLNEFEFTAQIGMCGGGGISFKKESYSVLIDEENEEEYWVFNSSTEKVTGYVWSLWTHYTGYKAMAILGDGREEELKDLALKALNEAVQGNWYESKALVSSWVNNQIEETPSRLCTCGSGEEAYLCNGLPEEGWAYCG